MSKFHRPIGIFYEHPNWFKPLFQELETRKIPFVRIHAADHQYNPSEREVPYSLVVNRVSSSAFLRGNTQGIFQASNYLAHVERLGIPVINGTAAQEIERSRIKQIELLTILGLPFPRTRIVNHINQIIPAALSLSFPIVVKPNLQGGVSSVQKFSSLHQLNKAIQSQQINLGIDHTALVQEFIPAFDNKNVRVEILNGKYLYAVKIHTRSESFNLRPFELFGEETSKKVDPFKSNILVEAYSPSQQIVREVERIAKEAKLDAGAVEYVISEQSGKVYYCNIIALSNFVADPVNVIGFNPYADFVDMIEGRLRPAFELEPVEVL
jgi:hypothetical protein